MKKLIVAALIAGSLFIASPAQAHGSHYKYLRHVNGYSALARQIPNRIDLSMGHSARSMLVNGASPRRVVRIWTRSCTNAKVGGYTACNRYARVGVRGTILYL